MKTKIESNEILSSLISGLDLRCGGRGTCGRCRVLLLSGLWDVNGVKVEAPAEALACRTRLLSETGEVETADTPSGLQEDIRFSEWASGPLPVSSEPVIAIDIGTTTIAAAKIHNGEIVHKVGCYNSQSRFGDNVITRINYGATAPGNLNELQKAVVNSINELLSLLDVSDITRIAVSGNTVMSCILHKVDPSSIGVMPFTPSCRKFPVCNAQELGINVDVPLLTMPSISGYVGGDITAGWHETGLKPGEMLVDIGTNCEILFNTPDGVFCTAAAAGPAFEGAGIYCGSRAVPGAVDHWYGDGEFSVIGNIAPTGICGSAMIDFLAVARRNGLLNEFGRIQPKADSFAIVPGINIHEWEIEQLLKAKAAVYAGIKTLSAHCGVEIKKICLAGTFARHIDLANAIAINMLPECEYLAVGNTSLAGAVRLAIQPELLAELERFSDIPKEIPLNTIAEFEDNYIDGLLLP
ncbi:MAG: ASKHA domain-containing protein [Victivallaceae bacterium]|nr:ASKHA domain-containing protein [Victivallaceae bacterium]